MAKTNGKKSGAQLQHDIDEVLRMRQKKQGSAKVAQPASRASNDAEHERRERAEAQQRLAEVRRQPLSDRKEAQAKFLETMRVNPELIAERLGWLLDGSYGYGAMLLAKQVLGSPRMNRSAALTQMVGAFEWMVPEEPPPSRRSRRDR